MGHAELYKAVIHQSLDDLYANTMRRRQYAIDWIFSSDKHYSEVTCEEACDFSGNNIFNIRRIAEAIIKGKLTYEQYKNIMKEEYDGAA